MKIKEKTETGLWYLGEVGPQSVEGCLHIVNRQCRPRLAAVESRV